MGSSLALFFDAADRDDADVDRREDVMLHDVDRLFG